MSERERALFKMLGKYDKGLQMSRKWLDASVSVAAMKTAANKKNRFVYVFFAIGDEGKSTSRVDLNKRKALGIGQHFDAVKKIGQAGMTGEKINLSDVHEQHKPDHEYSDMFSYREIDDITKRYEANLAEKPKKDKAPATEAPITEQKQNPTQNKRKSRAKS
jgi:hypothetical protein